jgi:hypothetical protein
LSQRPTLGDGDSEKFPRPRWLADRPLFLRTDLGIPIDSALPIAVKRHTLWDQFEGKMIFLVRNPIHSIVSHTRDMTDEKFRKVLPSEVAAWVTNVDAYSSWDPNQKLLIQHTKLVSHPGHVAAQLVKFLQLHPSHQALRHFETVGLSRSQSVSSVRGSLSVGDPGIYERAFKDRCETAAAFIRTQNLHRIVESVLSQQTDPH